jgi:ferric-chelate reductase
MYALDSSGDGDEKKDEAFSTGNPTMTLEEAESRSSWYGITTETGIAVLIVIVIITITASAFIRRRNYNFFYYTHVVCSICIFIGASIHASTDFYLLLPGLCLWIVDLAWRAFSGEAGGLHEKTSATLENAGQGWYRLSLPVLIRGSGHYSEIPESSTEMGQSSSTPLKSYYVNVPCISKIQNHAFTAAFPNSATSGPVFLFQRAHGKASKKVDKEWTWKLGALVPTVNESIEVEVRLEGPYAPRNLKYEQASHIICIVGGTGITGAYSLAIWWLKMRAHNSNTGFTLVWTIRHRDMTDFKEWLHLEGIAASTPNLSIVTHVSSVEGRLKPGKQIRQSLGLGSPLPANLPVLGEQVTGVGSAWVYSSGPDGLLHATETACVEIRREIKASKGTNEIDWYMAKWEL